ncbi:MAG: hypothetical protein QM589_11065 [Thermomicrobiales bacterium]
MSGTSNTTGRWEYHVERVSELPSTERLNSLGADRWELVTADIRLGTLIFKRPAPTLAEQITLDQRTRVQNAREAGS